MLGFQLGLAHGEHSVNVCMNTWMTSELGCVGTYKYAVSREKRSVG